MPEPVGLTPPYLLLQLGNGAKLGHESPHKCSSAGCALAGLLPGDEWPPGQLGWSCGQPGRDSGALRAWLRPGAELVVRGGWAGGGGWEGGGASGLRKPVPRCTQEDLLSTGGPPGPPAGPG